MNSGQAVALHYITREPVSVAWADGRITSLDPAAGSSPAGRYIAPALFDVQVNGYAGIDFQQDDFSLDQLHHAVAALRRDGCTRIFFTLITAEWSQLMARLRRARELRQQSTQLQAAIAGWHIEGPFLSDQPGFCGAHDPAVMCDPTAQHIRELRSLCGDDPLLLTIAPERRGAIEAIEAATSAGIIVSLGHTDAPGPVLRDAVAAGATGFTHLANGCPRELDRHDNILWRVSETEGLTVSFIPDGIHVSPAPFRLLHRLFEQHAIYYTTDAMSAAGAPPGRYPLGKLELEVGADQIVRQPGRTNFAGSALRPIDGVFRAAGMLKCPWQECWRRLSEAPAAFVRVRHELQVGAPADFCLVEVDGQGNLISSTVP